MEGPDDKDSCSLMETSTGEDAKAERSEMGEAVGMLSLAEKEGLLEGKPSRYGVFVWL